MSNNQVRKKTNIKAANTVWTPKPSSILPMITPEHASMFIIQIKFFTLDHLTQNFRASQEEKIFIPDNLPPLADSWQLLGQEFVRRLASFVPLYYELKLTRDELYRSWNFNYP